MNTFPVILLALGVLAIGYRYYSKFIAMTVLGVDETRQTPAHTHYDGQNYYPMSKWVLFGHHFAGIAGSGPLIGPTLAAQFGFLPGLLWIVLGVVLAGAVQDLIILFASVRRGGKSLAEIARREISGFSGFTAAVAILFVVIIAEAGLGLAVVNALAESSWGTFTIGMTIPLALIMGVWMYKLRPGNGIREATIIGVFFVHPDFKMPALTQYTAGGGPIVPGPMFPFAFITIACGSISGFHSLIASGTTPKMISSEAHIRPIGYGAMLMEGVVGLMALVAATSMFPGDYFAINTPVPQYVAKVQAQYPIVNLPNLAADVGESVQGRPGGA